PISAPTTMTRPSSRISPSAASTSSWSTAWPPSRWSRKPAIAWRWPVMPSPARNRVSPCARATRSCSPPSMKPLPSCAPMARSNSYRRSGSGLTLRDDRGQPAAGTGLPALPAQGGVVDRGAEPGGHVLRPAAGLWPCPAAAVRVLAAAVAGTGLCVVFPRHAPAGAVVHDLLRPAATGHPARSAASRVDRFLAEHGGLHCRDPARSNCLHRPWPVGGGRQYRHGTRADSLPGHPAAGRTHRPTTSGQQLHLVGQGHRPGCHHPGARAVSPGAADHCTHVRDLHHVPGRRPDLLVAGQRAGVLPGSPGTPGQPTRAGRLMISVCNLRKSFNGQEVLKGIDLDIAPGEVLAIIGPSGSGKTTLLRCLNLLEQPSGGQLSVGAIHIDRKS